MITYRISFLVPGTHFKIDIDKPVHSEEENHDGKRHSEMKRLVLRSFKIGFSHYVALEGNAKTHG